MVPASFYRVIFFVLINIRAYRWHLYITVLTCRWFDRIEYFRLWHFSYTKHSKQLNHISPNKANCRRMRTAAFAVVVSSDIYRRRRKNRHKQKRKIELWNVCVCDWNELVQSTLLCYLLGFVLDDTFKQVTAVFAVWRFIRRCETVDTVYLNNQTTGNNNRTV